MQRPENHSLISMCTWTHLCFPSSTFSPSPLHCRGNSTIATSWIISSQICTGSDGVKALAIILLKLMCLYLCSAPMIAVSEDWLMQTWPGQCFWLLGHPFNRGYWVALADWLALVLLVKIHTEDPCPTSLFWMLNVHMMEWFCLVACSSARLTARVEPAGTSALVIFRLFASMWQ